MRFSANSMVAYEEATGKFFLDTVASLYDVMRPLIEAQKAGLPANANPLEIVRNVPMKDLRALIWASLHEYVNDEPVWPLTIHQVGRMLQLNDIPRVFTAFLKGQSKNSPTTEEMGESQTPPVLPNPRVTSKEADGGGERSIELPADAFA